jgi:hypothetical protein
LILSPKSRPEVMHSSTFRLSQRTVEYGGSASQITELVVTFGFHAISRVDLPR